MIFHFCQSVSPEISLNALRSQAIRGECVEDQKPVPYKEVAVLTSKTNLPPDI